VAQETVFSGKSYRNFIEAVHSPFTRSIYRNALFNYMRFKKVESCDLLLKEDPRIVEEQLIDYVIYNREELDIASNSISTKIAPIRKFYECNDIELRWKKIKSYIGRNKGKGGVGRKKDRPYTHKEIAKMLEKADQRGRVTILLMSSAGIRVGALPSLEIRNLEKIEEYQLYKITVYEGEDEEYVTFCTPECAKEIDSYLEYRKRHGEYPLKDDAPLIREEFDIDDEIKATHPRHLGRETFKKMIGRIGLRSGVIEKTALTECSRGYRRPVKETHGFRKFFQTTAIGNGMSPLYSEILMGHTSGGLALESYLRPSENDLLEGNDKMIGYIGVMEALTINEENNLRRKVTILAERDDEVQKMKFEHEQEMKSMREEMTQQFSQIMSMIQQNPKLAQLKPEALANKKIDGNNFI
jgi:integrase